MADAWIEPEAHEEQSAPIAQSEQAETASQAAPSSKSEAAGATQDAASDEKHTIGSPGWFKTAKPSTTDNPNESVPAAEKTVADSKETTAQAPEQPAEDKKSKKSSIGAGWLKSANPFSKRSSTDQKDAKPAATEPQLAPKEKEPEVNEADLPPNQLGTQVPVGQSADIAAPGDSAPGKLENTESASDTCLT